MYDTIRASPFGLVARYITKDRLFTYPEERHGFQLPHNYASPSDRNSVHSLVPSIDSIDDKRKSEIPSEVPSERLNEVQRPSEHTKLEDRTTNLDVDIEKKQVLEPQPSNPGLIIVTWYSDDDQENPLNWKKWKKVWVGTVILLYTLSVYISASLYTAAIPTMQEKWSLGTVAVSVGLSIYVIGYGLGPLIMSPLSEIPQIGRNPPYIICFAIFVILCVPIALVDNFAGMLVLRFLMGLFGSPALASGGASFGDFCGPMLLPYAIALWAGGASAGPVRLPSA